MRWSEPSRVRQENGSNPSKTRNISIDTHFQGITTLFSPSPEKHKVETERSYFRVIQRARRTIYFAKWKTNQGSFLWLHGIPGCGKTFLSATIIEDAKNNPYRKADPSKSYSITTRAALYENDEFLKSPEMLETLKAKNAPPSQPDPRDTPDSTTPEFDQVYIVLDALDECTEGSKLLRRLKKFFETHTDKLHLIVTSRKERIIEQYLDAVD
ncbi:hypothetical protein IFR05_009020 [Cadophora sp. M221]|nr:hypothetical protein IFR05_009020 [Cadophora sp. M221]